MICVYFVVSIDHGHCSKTGPATLLALDGVEESLAARDSQAGNQRWQWKSPTIWRFQRYFSLVI